MSRPLLVLHDLGSADAGGPWRSVEWKGDLLAPDLPGHGSAALPVGEAYALADPALWALPVLRDAGWTDPPIILGVGRSGLGAEVLAAGGRAAVLVLVDGLGGPWLTPTETAAATRAWVRGVFADRDSLAPAGDRRPDPRLAHGFPPPWERRFIEGLRGSITVPVLALETPASPTPAAEQRDRLASYGGAATLTRITSADPETVYSALAQFVG
jgi:hypothetical protein